MADHTSEYNPPVRFDNLRVEMNRFFAQARSDMKREARRQRARRIRILCERYLGGKGAIRILDRVFITFFGVCFLSIVFGIITIAIAVKS